MPMVDIHINEIRIFIYIETSPTYLTQQEYELEA